MLTRGSLRGARHVAKQDKCAAIAFSGRAGCPASRSSSTRTQALSDVAFVQTTTTVPGVQQVSELAYELDGRSGLQRIKYEPTGWYYWDWEDEGTTRKVHYIRAGNQGDPVVVLVHGYGASSYHWRYNVPALAEAGYQVYAVDLLGFGYSEKARTDYTNGKVWAQQVSTFVRDVVWPQTGSPTPVVLAGNSLGGFVSLATAAEGGPELVRAVALLNGAGPFREANGPTPEQEAAEWADTSLFARAKRSVANTVKRGVMFFAFQRTKQPERIREVLNMVYARPDNVDDDLVTSIENPAKDPAAAEVFYLVSSNNGPPQYVNDLLPRLGGRPLLLLWGDRDPWVTPARAAKIQALYPEAVRVGLDSGHCPHDDTPQEANQALIDWLRGLPAAPGSSA